MAPTCWTSSVKKTKLRFVNYLLVFPYQPLHNYIVRLILITHMYVFITMFSGEDIGLVWLGFSDRVWKPTPCLVSKNHPLPFFKTGLETFFVKTLFSFPVPPRYLCQKSNRKKVLNNEKVSKKSHGKKSFWKKVSEGGAHVPLIFEKGFQSIKKVFKTGFSKPQPNMVIE